MTRVAGLPNANSERAFDMFVKTRHVMDKHGGRSGVVFATGTPVSNSMAEMWTMQRYLQPATLRGNHVAQFDTWAGNFGESVTALELSPDGGGYRMNTRFRPLRQSARADDDVPGSGRYSNGGHAEAAGAAFPSGDGDSQAHAELKAFVATLVERAEAIRNGNSVAQRGQHAGGDQRWPQGRVGHAAGRSS
jgi:hypothetical protein